MKCAEGQKLLPRYESVLCTLWRELITVNDCVVEVRMQIPFVTKISFATQKKPYYPIVSNAASLRFSYIVLKGKYKWSQILNSDWHIYLNSFHILSVQSGTDINKHNEKT
jgi:hypothetical protein